MPIFILFAWVYFVCEFWFVCEFGRYLSVSFEYPFRKCLSFICEYRFPCEYSLSMQSKYEILQMWDKALTWFCTRDPWSSFRAKFSFNPLMRSVPKWSDRLSSSKCCKICKVCLNMGCYALQRYFLVGLFLWLFRKLTKKVESWKRSL